jgi:hypothetical protein
MSPFPFRLQENREELPHVLVFASGVRTTDLGVTTHKAELQGFARVFGQFMSVGEAKGGFIRGAALEITQTELDRLDSYIDSLGEDYHRFETEVLMTVGDSNPGWMTPVKTWVYQKAKHRSHFTSLTSSNPSFRDAALQHAAQ